MAIEVEVGIVGAGIHGAALARELSLRGVSCAMIDRGPIGGGTSQWSTQLLHGGIRYLRTGDIAQMREGLAERATWMRIAPHRGRWESFWMPHRSWWQGFTHRIGIGAYDRWGHDRPGWPADDLRLGRVPRSEFRADPRAAGGPFRGAVAFADLMTWDRELVRDLAASAPDARVFERHEIVEWESDAERLTTAVIRPTAQAEGSPERVSARQWVTALGPWLDEALNEWFGETRWRLRLSAGIHLWFPLEGPLAGCVRPWAAMRDKTRILFMIPRDGYLQVGTTEREVQKPDVQVTEEERDDLFAGLQSISPGIPWRELPVAAAETGVRPLIATQQAVGKNTARVSREARLETDSRFANLTHVVGGKLTTARLLMDQLATTITGRACPESRTTPLVVTDPTTAGLGVPAPDDPHATRPGAE